MFKRVKTRYEQLKRDKDELERRKAKSESVLEKADKTLLDIDGR